MVKIQSNKGNSIAFFDSGIGGLTVLKEMQSLLPFEHYIYFADTLNNPYGLKPINIVNKCIIEAVEFLNSKNIKMLVIACNTATTIAIEYLRSKYKFLIVGIEPAIKVPLDSNLQNNILLLATSLTLKSDSLNKLIDTVAKDRNQVIKMPADALVKFAEDFDFVSQEVDNYVKEIFSKVDLNEISAVVLGCTHFSYFKNSIKRIINNKDIIIIDGNYPTALNASNLLKANNLLNHDNISHKLDFYSTNGSLFEAPYIKKLQYALSYINTSTT